MKKRLLAALVCLALLTGAALADGAVPRAAEGYDTAALERYESFALDAVSGLWSVDDPLFSALEDAVAQNEARNLLNDGVLLWQLRLAGNAKTGTLAPALEFALVAREPFGVRAVSVIVDGKRYDCAVRAEAAPFGGTSAERFLAPLDETTLSLPEAIAAAGQVTILVHGSARNYVCNAARGADGGVRERLEGQCLDCLRLGAELSGLRAAEYHLWDLTAAEAGGAPLWSAVDLSAESEYASLLPGPGRTLSAGVRGDATSEAQRLLRANGFFAGADEQPYGPKTAAAVARAQRYFGLAETGSVDEALLACLNGAPARSAAEEEQPALEPLSTARIGLKRWWCAGSVSATKAAAGVGTLECADAANRFLVAEGLLQNAGAAELGLGWQLTARAILDGEYAYDCAVRVEKGSGDGFLSTLTPLGEGRLLLLAEIPAGALEAAGSIAVEVSLGGEKVSYALLGE